MKPGKSVAAAKHVPLSSQLHARLLDNPAASPYWLKPPMIDAEDASKAVQALSTPLHDAARAGRYELLSMMLHHSRGRGLLPAACLALDGNGERTGRWTDFRGRMFDGLTDERRIGRRTDCNRLTDWRASVVDKQ